jgi:hypothetical protein
MGLDLSIMEERLHVVGIKSINSKMIRSCCMNFLSLSQKEILLDCQRFHINTLLGNAFYLSSPAFLINKIEIFHLRDSFDQVSHQRGQQLIKDDGKQSERKGF